MVEKIFTGYWDGKPIWRYKTAAERLADAIEDNDGWQEHKANQAIDRQQEGEKTCGDYEE